MTKKDLLLIHSFIDSKNFKEVLNFAHLKDDGIYATDTKKCIMFSIPMLDLDLFLEKKILKGFIAATHKDSIISFDGLGYMKNGTAKLNCDTFDCNDVTGVDFDYILNQKFSNQFFLESIDDLQFELAQRNCFIDEEHINPIIAYAECSGFNIFYNEQKEELSNGIKVKNSGVAKIIGRYSTEDESNIVKFTAVIMGRTFESKAIEE